VGRPETLSGSREGTGGARGPVHVLVAEKPADGSGGLFVFGGGSGTSDPPQPFVWGSWNYFFFAAFFLAGFFAVFFFAAFFVAI
jgi:hypothetical protein